VSVDDRLRRGFEELPPADPAGAYERIVEKKVRRGILRRVETGILAIVVVLGSVTSLVLLLRAFEGGTTPRAPSATSSVPAPTATETPTPPPGQNIGLAFNLCDVRTLNHVDVLGDGVDGTAWTGAPLTAAGRCPRQQPDAYVVAVDVTGDDRADDVWGTLRYCFECEPYAAIDLDGDGDQELIVLESGGTTPQYDVFDVREVDGRPRLRPVVVEPPGDSEAGFPAGKMLQVTVGGDEGFSGRLACEGDVRHPTLVAAWTWAPVDGPGSQTEEAHVAVIVVKDGSARVVESSNTTQPSGDDVPSSVANGYQACGIDWYPLG
jgi:hypothetical protein